MGEDESLQPDGELDIARPDHVLDLEVLKFGGKSQLLHDPRVLPGGQPGVLLGLGAGTDHLPYNETVILESDLTCVYLS